MTTTRDIPETISRYFGADEHSPAGAFVIVEGYHPDRGWVTTSERADVGTIAAAARHGFTAIAVRFWDSNPADFRVEKNGEAS